MLGVALAFLVERTDLPGRRVWHGLLVAPLAVPAFVNGYAWVSLDRSVHGFAGAFGVVTLSYYPLVYLPVVAMLRRLDPALEESAWSLGHSRARTFRTVVLPQLRPALLGGALLVGLHLLAEFGALSLLRFPTFTTAIYDQYGSTFNGAAATAMAGVLVLLCLVLLLADLRLRGDRRYARVGRGAARSVVPVALGPWRLAGRSPPSARSSALAVGVPAYSLVRWLVVGTSTQFPLAELTEALVATVVLALAGAAVTTLAAVPVVWLAVRHRGCGLHPHRAQHLRRQRAARHRRRPRPRRGVAAAGAGRLPDRDPARGGVRHPLPAARRGDRARRARAGAGRARRRRAQPRRRAARHRPPGHAAAHRARASAPAPRWSSSRSRPS